MSTLICGELLLLYSNYFNTDTTNQSGWETQNTALGSTGYNEVTNQFHLSENKTEIKLEELEVYLPAPLGETAIDRWKSSARDALTFR